jgi:3-oxoacyl-[acyl-carrier protein] reductase
MKTALITGAGSATGIGMATARALAAQGHRLVIASTTGRIAARAAELVAEGATVRTFQGDLTEAETVQRLADLAGPVDILVNNAGMASLTDPAAPLGFLAMSMDDWRRQIDVSLTSAVLVTRAVLPGMLDRGWGRVIMVASVTGPVVSFPGASHYAAAKAGMMGLVRTLALEVAAQGVTINAVAPGWIDTGALGPDEVAAARATPMRRAGRSEEAAACAAFLASDAASYVNGVLLVVDGGNSLQEMKGA